MRSKEKILYIILICVSAVLIATLIFGLFRMKKDLTAAQKTNSQNITDIKERDEKIAGLEQENQTIKSENERIKSELDSANAEKENLKKEIENLKLKKQQAAQAAVNKPAPPAPVVVPSSANRVCYLTFDDGPSPRTLEILEILRRYNVKATFFVINTENFDYIKQVHAEGHAVGLHAFDHNYANIYSSTTNYFNDLQTLSDKIFATIGVRPNIMRFPGGGSNLVSKPYCPGIMSFLTKEVGAKGYTYFDWNVDSNDAGGSGSSYTAIVNNVLNGSNGKNSICVLMHDAKAKRATVQALPHIIEGLAARGFKFEVLTNGMDGFHHGVKN